jgi:hypothetical protein
MKAPRFLLGATLLFWGWQAQLPVMGILLAVGIESAAFIKARWDFSDDDFSRAWVFCTLLFLAAAVYAFTENEGPTTFQGFFHEPNLRTERGAGLTTARTAASLIKWLPMIFFLFMAAQVFSSRGGIPLATISLILRRRWKKAKKLGRPLPISPNVDISYAYFALCLFGASSHSSGESTEFFWGVCVLLTWALWSHRSPRFSGPTWAGALAVAIVLGYFGQGGLGRLRSYLETFNPQWLTGFSRRGFDASHSRTALGQIGKVKTSAKIVIRLEPKEHSPAPTLLREACYRTYKAQTWYAGNSRDEFENLLAETNATTWVLLPDKTNKAVVNLACYLQNGQGLLPLPIGAGRLENLPAWVLRKNTAGTVLAEGPGLVIFDARYGPGATIDSAPASEDFVVPPREVEGLEQVISEMQLTNRTVEAAMHTMNGFFQGQFKYRTWQDWDRVVNTNETPLARFLLHSRSGHCEYFATATVLLMRKLGIPARYAVGYAVHELAGRKYVVRLRDAHAWCLVWNENKKLWQDFDTTPASWVESEAGTTSPLQFIEDGWSRMVYELSRLRWGQTHMRQYLLWALVPTLLLLLYQIIFRSRRRRHRSTEAGAAGATAWPGLDSELYRLEEKLSERGLVRGVSEPISTWLRRATSDPALAGAEMPLRELLGLHYRYRFDPQGLNETDREALRRAATKCLAGVEQARV